MKTFVSLLSLAVGLLVGSGGVGYAGSGKAMCLMNAQTNFKACQASCKTDFLDAKAACLHIQPGCLQACLDGRDECVATVRAPLDACLALCDPPLDAAKAACRTQCGCGAPANPCGFNPCFIGCVQGPETTAFECRDTCEDAFELNTAAQAALQACRAGFKTCLKSCPASPSGAFLD